ncbi:MAG: PKD domain-containing protein [Flavobacteriales bacterium]|nr:PKD domain-containing protein [Flavobacteriales bacterium]
MKLPILMAFLWSFSAQGQTCSGLGSTNYSDVIYVSVTGLPSSAGTANDPTDLLTGIGMLGGNANKVYIQGGTYVLTAALQIPNNAQLIGGFNSQWVKDNSAISTIYRDPSNPQMSPPRLIAIECIGKSGFRIQDLTIRTDNGFGQGVTTYGVYLNNCSDYQIVRCSVISGNGGNGVAGSFGTLGAIGVNGQEGEAGHEHSSGNRQGGSGGCCSFPGSFAGGDGGNGGERGTYVWPSGGQAFTGYLGQDGSGLGFGSGGNGGMGNFTSIVSTSCDQTPSNNGQYGDNGADGLDGIPGVVGTYSLTGGFFTPGVGSDGTDGENGSGGGGGGGGGSYGGQLYTYIPWPIDDTIPSNSNGTGAGGGGGGEGGGGGTAGGGGQGGGGSFAIFAWDNGFNGVLKDCELASGFPGVGGLGGIGGNGGQGGHGGEGGAKFTACHIGAGGDGGEGGHGGKGGDGGAGSNGISSELYQHPGGQPLVLQNIYGLSQPTVNVELGGCTNSPVRFSTDISGTIQWFFGSGANPSTAFGQEVVATFSTPGFKTFTLLVNGIAFTYTDFVDIYSEVPPLNPQIQTGSTQLCVGDVSDFNSSISANNYIWELVNIEGDTVIYNGPNYYDLLGVSWDSAGVYQLTLTTETECCGQSFTDTVMIVVDSIIPPAISVQTQFADTTNTVCVGSQVTFTASAQNVGQSPSYQWNVNGSPIGADAPVLTTDQLADGDVVSCTVTSSLGCAAGQTAMSNTIPVTVVPAPQITCAADSFLSGEPTFFTSEVTFGGLAPFSFYWSFGDGLLGFGDTVQHVYQNPGTYTATVDVYDSLGCSVSCQTFMTISPSISAAFSVDTLVGCAPLEVHFTNQSENAVTNFWSFGDGSGSSVENPVHTYQTAGTYDVALWIYAGNGNDSAVVYDQVVVNPTPVANFYSYEVNPQTGSDTVHFSDNSLFADSWYWDFGDPSSGSDNTSTDQSPVHVYSSNGSYYVTLVVSNNYGCIDSITLPSSVNVGISELRSQLRPVIFPNPTSERFNILIDSKERSTVSFNVIDPMGKVVMGRVLKVSVGSNRFDVDIEQLSAGTYVIQLRSGDETHSLPLVISRR